MPLDAQVADAVPGFTSGGGSLLHAVSGGIAAGHIGTLNVHPPGRDEPAWPRQVGVVPARAGAFQDRAERARLRTAVEGGGTAVLCQVLSGMGGVGKTQLAAEYAHEVRAAGGVDLLVWISAGSRSAVVAGYAEAAVGTRTVIDGLAHWRTRLPESPGPAPA